MHGEPRRRGRARRAISSGRPHPRRAQFIALAAHASCGPKRKARPRRSLLFRLSLAFLLLILLSPLVLEAPAQTPVDPPPGSTYWQRNNPVAHADPQRTGSVNITLPVAELTVLWQAKGGAPIFAGPVMDEERVYTVDRDGIVTARWVADGELAWKRDLGAKVSATPALAYGWLYVAAMNGKLHALERHTGVIMQTGDITKDARAPTLVAEGRVFQGTDEGHLHALDARTLDPVWRFDTATTGYVNGTATLDASLRKAIRAPPSLHDGKVYAAANNGRIYALSVAGNVKQQPHALHWTLILGETHQAKYIGDWVHAAPVYDATRNQVIIATQDGDVIPLNPATGTPSAPVAGDRAYVGSVAVGRDILVTLSSDHGLRAFDPTTKTERWRHEDPGGFLTAPVLTRNAVVALAGNGTVFLAGVATGKILPHRDTQDGLARWQLGAATHATPAVTRGGIAITDHTGQTTLIGPVPKLKSDLRAQPIRLIGAPDANGTVDVDLRVENRGPDPAPAIVARFENGGGIIREETLGGLAVGKTQRWVVRATLSPGTHDLSVRFEAIGATDPNPGAAAATRTLSVAPPAPDPTHAGAGDGDSSPLGFTAGLVDGFTIGLIPAIVGTVGGVALFRFLRSRAGRFRAPTTA